MNDLFDTPEKAESAVANFKSLQEHPGWKLFTAVLDANIELLRSQLENGIGDGETKADIDRIRDKLTLYRELRDTPELLIERLRESQGAVPNTDPFETVEELRSRRQEDANQAN